MSATAADKRDNVVGRGRRRYGALVAPADFWDPSAYLQWARPRTRPVRDLLWSVDHPDPRLVVDLGCGPGNNTELVADRWPDAYVLGIDSSPHMIEAATARQRPGRLEFRVGDLREWVPDAAPDVILANAVLQWLPDHLTLLPRIAGLLAPGGVLGLQMPAEIAGGVIGIAYELAATDAWRDKTTGAPRSYASSVRAPADYLTALADAGLDAEAWETSYTFPLGGEGSLAQYVAGSVIRPLLSGLSPDEAGRFLADYSGLLRTAQPPYVIGGRPVEVLRQRRVFAAGRRED